MGTACIAGLEPRVYIHRSRRLRPVRL